MTEIEFENVQESNTNVSEEFEFEVSEVQDAYVKALMGARQPNMLKDNSELQPPSYLAEYIS